MLTRLLVPGPAGMSLLLVLAIVAGAGIGHVAPNAGQWLGGRVDAILLALIVLLFFGIQAGAIVRAFGHLRFIMTAVLANFVLVPLLGHLIAQVFLPDHPWLVVGLTIYFMAPCTDWFLAFTRLAKGDVALGTALIPINMVLQLLLYPWYLQWFTQHLAQVEAGLVGATMVQWFLVPLCLAQAAHLLLRALLPGNVFLRMLRCTDQLTPWFIAALILAIFASNIGVIQENLLVFGWLLLAAFVFFVATFLLGEGLSRWLNFRYPEHALLTMTLAARNAPLMLAVTMAALPDRPLVYAAIVIGMLLEFPHLALLRRLLLRTQGGVGPARQKTMVA